MHLTVEEGFYTNTGDSLIQLTRKRSSRHQGRPLGPQAQDQDFTLEPNMKPFLLPVLFLYAGTGLEYNSLICVSQATAKGVTSGI